MACWRNPWGAAAVTADSVLAAMKCIFMGLSCRHRARAQAPKIAWNIYYPRVASVLAARDKSR